MLLTLPPIAGCAYASTADSLGELLALGALDALEYASDKAAKPATWISGEVRFGRARYTAAANDALVRVYHADARPALDNVLTSHDIIARFQVRVWQDHDPPAPRESAAVDHTRALGGDALLVTRHSEIVGVIKRDVRYGGPVGEEVFYALRSTR